MRLPWQKTEPAPAAPPITAVEVAEIARAEGRAAAVQGVQEAAKTALLNMKEAVLERAQGPSAPVPAAPWNPGGATVYPAYHYDNPIWFSTPVPPQRRPGSLVSVQTLRQLADNYDVLRACIEHLKREVSQVPVRVVPLDSKDDRRATRRAVKDVGEFLKQTGGLGGVGKRRSQFEGECIEDLCTVGASAVFHSYARGGALLESVALDAATIRPVVDAFGWPGPGDHVYEQWIWGVLAAQFRREELTYDGLHSRSWTPYFASPVEWLLNTVNSALRADHWNQAWLTDGNTPSDLLSAPETWTPDQIIQFAAYFDALLSGDSRARQKTRIVPGGMSRAGNPSRKDQDFQQFELWLLRRTCAIMGVQPASLGFAGEQYKVSQNDSMESTSQFGAGVLLDFRKATYDDAIAKMGAGALVECQNVTSREEKATERATRNSTLVSGAIKTPNEARLEEGLEAVDGGDELIIVGIASSLSSVLAGEAAPEGPAADPGGDPAGKTPPKPAPPPKPKGAPKTARRAPKTGDLERAQGDPTVYLVRHAITDLNDEKRARAWLDPSLNKDGRRLAKAIGRFLTGRGIEAQRASDLKRTVQTAKAVRKRTGAPLIERARDWRPWDLGDLEGRKTSDTDPIVADYALNKPGEPLPGGESLDAFCARFLPALQAVLDESSSGRVRTSAVVTHGRNLKLVRAWLKAGGKGLSVDVASFLADDVPMGAVLALTCRGGAWAGELLNAAESQAEG